jgi:hypothetical protein
LAKYKFYKKRLKKGWIAVIFLIIVGLWPANVFYLFYSYDEPNVLKIEELSCTCCPDAHIIKGKLIIPEYLKQKFPTLKNQSSEIELSGNNPFKQIWSDDTKYWYIVGDNIKISGQVLGVDSFDCGSYMDYAARFEVKDWQLASYEPIFFVLNRVFILIYLGLCLISIPYLLLWALFDWKIEKTTTPGP